VNYGPIFDACPEDRWDISSLIQRGLAVTDERLAAQALAYARFRVRLSSALALLYLALVGYFVLGRRLVPCWGLPPSWAAPCS
jgi:hypothetical protein